MFSELFGLLSSVDVSGKGKNKKFSVNLNRNRIRSISAYSSNSIFYFPTIVSDQAMPEEVAMIARMVEKSYASFVVACVSLMPFHRIKSDDRASIEEYLKQFHQNMGMNPGSGPVMNKMFGFIDNITIEESAQMSENEAVAQLQDFLMECWQKSVNENSDFIKVISETVSLNDMFNESAIDPKTRVLQEQFWKNREELDTWGFLGEASDDMFDSEEDLEEFERFLDGNPDNDDDDDYNADDDWDDDDDYPDVDSFLNDMNEGTVKSAIDSIKFSLESVSENKIMSCSSLTKLASLESKLKKLKNKYTKYLNRYKKKYKENKESGSRSKLTIRFNKMTISNPKTFMKQYGTYIKIINKRLKLVENRRAQLRTRKGLAEATTAIEVNVLTELTQMDFDTLDYCDKVISECLDAPDSEIFALTEDKTVSDADYERYQRLEKIVPSVTQRALGNQKAATALKREKKEYKETIRQKDQEIDKLNSRISDLEKNKKDTEDNTPLSDYDRARHKSNIDVAHVKNKANFETFDREVFTKMDMQKANEAIPIFTKASIGFIVDETEEVVTRDVLIGVKAYIHKAPSLELINDVYNCIINKRKFLRFVKFVTGEERSLSDLLFGFKELKADAMDAKQSAGEWRSAFKRRRRWAKMSVPYLTKEYTPNGTVVMTMNEVNFIKDQYGIDIMANDHVRMIMDADFLLGFVIIDQADEMVYVTYDGHGYGFQQYTYAMLEREQQTSDRMMRELYRSLSR